VREHGAADFVGQRIRRQDIYRHVEKLSQFALDRTNVEKGCLRRRIDEDIQITVLSVPACGDRPEHPRIPRAVCLDDSPNFGPMVLQSDRWLHVVFLGRFLVADIRENLYLITIAPSFPNLSIWVDPSLPLRTRSANLNISS
jgi:hypothetical protein